jgi:hypothetical protein
VIPWAHEKRKNDEQSLSLIEAQLEQIHQMADVAFSPASSRDEIKDPKARKRQLLIDQEVAWRLKGRAIWLDKGDENTKKIQAYAKGRKDSNIIWKLKDQEGHEVSSFEGLSYMRNNHFPSLFKAEQRVNIVDIVHLALFFPRFVDEDGNRDLFVEVTEAELQETLHSF